MRLRNVTLHQLRLFRSLGTHLSYTRVAEELHLTQPAVSIQIKRLEESVGMPLVEQMGKRLFLTEAGRELFEACCDVLERLRVLNEDMIGMEAGVKGPLNLAAITTAKYFMPHLLGVFLRDYPDVEPRLTITNQARVLERLENNLDDLVIMGTLPENAGLEAQYFLDNPLVVVAPPDHPLVGQKNIPLARIAEERFLSREPGSGTRAARSRLFAEHGLSANIYMELGSSEAIKQAVMAGMGISVLSLHNLRLELESGLIAVLDVEHFPLVRQWYAVHLKGKKLSNTARRFLDFLLQDGARYWREVQPHLPTAPARRGNRKKTAGG
ncbi:DNA-binding transcriptional LysR family regulator [Sulfuritortus calidifontis]|uniref:DNA-binding transcriptional LysR family regulator n=1 Tax=Sulfuritortus calidifontis TaxID=1914471 RepID=A0A4R3JYP4_9PROT|nr:LysR family transcriptional regulator [Sulfuritortus calidifontis]TCS72403.1 DNA-binding transcriptional LysR family regulator [Sulfuritortus calidifontis]